MRSLTANTTAAQKTLAPEYDVSVAIASRGSYTQDMATWASLHTDTHTNLSHASDFQANAIGLSDNTCLIVYLSSNKISIKIVATPSSSSSWSSATHTTLVSSEVTNGGGPPGIARNGSTIRIFYSYTDQLRYIQSTNNGSSWAAPVTIYNSSAAYVSFLNICATYDSVRGLWAVAYNALTGAGANRLRGASTLTNASWVNWDPVSADWQIAGLVWDPAGGDLVYVYLYLNQSSNRSQLSVESVSADETAFYEWLGDYNVADTIGYTTSRYFVWARLGVTLSKYHLVIQEKSSTAYNALAAINTAGDYQFEEPVLFPSWTANSVQLTPVTAGSSSLLVSATIVYLATAISRSATYTPIRYAYEQSAPAGGRLTCILEQGATVRPGDMLTLTRGAYKAGVGGSQAVIFRVAATHSAWTDTEVIAYDALGSLNFMIARRPAALLPAAWSWINAAYYIARRGGLLTDVSGSPWPTSPSTTVDQGFVWQANETAFSALYRLLLPADVRFLPGSATTHPTVYFRKPSSDTVSAYTYGGASGHPLIGARQDYDARNQTLVIVMGQVSTNPIDGEAWRISELTRLDGVRPQPIAYTNYYLNSSAELSNLATSEAERIVMNLPVARISAGANLGLELYDLIDVTDTKLTWSAQLWRVHSISEHYKQGRLTQEIDLSHYA